MSGVREELLYHTWSRLSEKNHAHSKEVQETHVTVHRTNAISTGNSRGQAHFSGIPSNKEHATFRRKMSQTATCGILGGRQGSSQPSHAPTIHYSTSVFTVTCAGVRASAVSRGGGCVVGFAKAGPGGFGVPSDSVRPSITLDLPTRDV